MPEAPMTVTVSVSRKVSLGNYESADVFTAVSNIRIGATTEEIQAAIITGDLAFQVIAAAVWAEADRLRG